MIENSFRDYNLFSKRYFEKFEEENPDFVSDLKSGDFTNVESRKIIDYFIHSTEENKIIVHLYASKYLPKHKHSQDLGGLDKDVRLPLEEYISSLFLEEYESVCPAHRSAVMDGIIEFLHGNSEVQQYYFDFITSWERSQSVLDRVCHQHDAPAP